jgi:hypothetical protein
MSVLEILRSKSHDSATHHDLFFSVHNYKCDYRKRSVADPIIPRTSILDPSILFKYIIISFKFNIVILKELSYLKMKSLFVNSSNSYLMSGSLTSKL